MLTRPLPDLSAWTAFFAEADIPVHRATRDAIEALRERIDEVAPREIAERVQEDPLMTLKLLAHAGRHRSKRLQTDAETVTSTLVLMGVSPFFESFATLRCVEDLLADDPRALRGLESVIERSFRAARFALGFAVHRMDPDAEVIQEAALLHDFTEMLLWCHAAPLALEIQRRQRDDPALRSAAVQRAVLGIELADLEQALMRAWGLPALLAEITSHAHSEQAQVRNVLLAVDLARHSQRGWDNAALPDDYRGIGALLNVSVEHAHELALDLDT